MKWATIFGFWLSAVCGQRCIDDFGNPIDWLYGYKLPTLKDEPNPLIQNGIAYLYISSNNSRANWKLSSYSVNDSDSFLGRTLASIYEKNTTDLFYMMYNDDPPSSSSSNIYAHAKGVVIANASVGMWLVHSCPKFPIEPVTNTTKKKKKKKKKPKSKHTSYKFKLRQTTEKNKFTYPETATRYGQSFLCITLRESQLDKLGYALQYMRPQVYSYHIPETFESKYPNLTAAAKKQYIKEPPWQHKTNLRTSKGRTFVSYAKSRQFGHDLYSYWLAPDLKSDLEVETWSNGPNELPSDCKSKYQVMDVKAIAIKGVLKDPIRFKNSQDHSKWAVTFNSTSKVICVGDINRMESQYKRGGGTVCWKNSFVWSRYSNAIEELQPCVND